MRIIAAFAEQRGVQGAHARAQQEPRQALRRTRALGASLLYTSRIQTNVSRKKIRVYSKKMKTR